MQFLYNLTWENICEQYREMWAGVRLFHLAHTFFFFFLFLLTFYYNWSTLDLSRYSLSHQHGVHHSVLSI